MPLRAIVNGEEIVAPLLSAEEWTSLRDRVKSEQTDVRTVCCNSPAYLRTSKYGFHHFVHKTENCESDSETWQHIKAKFLIARACRSVGYDPTIECIGEGWRADVLAVNGSTQIAFEVQWSPQTWNTTQERQNRYKDAGVKCLWLFRNPPKESVNNPKVPSFKLTVSKTRATVELNQPTISYFVSLESFIRKALTDRLRYRHTQRVTNTYRVAYILGRCSKCLERYLVYTMETEYIEPDHHKSTRRSSLRECTESSTRTAIKDHVETSTHLKEYSLGNLKTWPESKSLYFECPHCQSISDQYLILDYFGRRPKNLTRAKFSRIRWIDELPLTLSITFRLDKPYWILTG